MYLYVTEVLFCRYESIRTHRRYMFSLLTTAKPVLRGYLWDKKKWPYKTGDLLKEVHFI